MFVDADGVILDVNDTLIEWVGDTRDNLKGSHFSTVLQLRMPLTHGNLTPGDALILTRTGNTLPVAVGRVSVEDDGTSQIAAFDVSPLSGFERPFAVASDATDRGKQRLQILFNASVGFGEVRTENEAARLLADVARRAFAATAVGVHLVRGGTLALVAGENPLADHWPQDLRSTGERTLVAGEVLVVGDPDIAEQYVPGAGMPDVFRRAGISSALAAPIRSEGVGLGSFICYFDQPRHFDDEAVPLAEALANQTAQALRRMQLAETFRAAALQDSLTGLPSRRLIEEQVSQLLTVGAKILAVMFIDLDGFKRVNDTLGHAAGDMLLAQVGQRLRGAVRHGDLIGRFGGDEFIAVAPVRDVSDAADIAERIRAAFDTPFAGVPAGLHVTASVGVTVTTTREEHILDQLIRAADQTMYQAKRDGGNRIALATNEDPPVVLTPS